MSEKFATCVASVASGTDKTLINIFHSAGTPTNRGAVKELVAAGTGAPADAYADFYFGRTTAVGTEGSGLIPNNLDSGGPAGDFDSGLGVFSVEPTYTAAKQFLRFTLNHRNTWRYVCDVGWEFLMTATQNNGAGLKTTGSTGTASHGATIIFME
jgi:hypothetical protein